jgi:hypothetical protein
MGPKAAMLWLSGRLLLRPKANGHDFMSRALTQRNPAATSFWQQQWWSAPSSDQATQSDCRKICTTGNSHIAAMQKLPVALSCRGLRRCGKPETGAYAQQPASPRGTLRPIVTKREAGCDGYDLRARTKRADESDEAVWSRHPDAGVKLRETSVSLDDGD